MFTSLAHFISIFLVLHTTHNGIYFTAEWLQLQVFRLAIVMLNQLIRNMPVIYRYLGIYVYEGLYSLIVG